MKHKNSTPNFPIDLVYLWVDGNDPKWQAKRNQYMNIGGDFAVQGRVEARWIENDELRYSLRSVEMYAPWINRIFIVTDSQCPSWLNTSNPRIRIVDHSEIMPQEALPNYNSTAIESCIYKIPELSEHFLFGNDDMLFSEPVSPDTFYTSDGRPIIRLSGTPFNRKKARRRNNNYATMILNMQDIVTRMFGEKIYYAPHHNIDAYRKSDFERCINLTPERWEQTILHRFRHDNDMHRSIIAYYSIASGQGVMRKVGRYNRIDGIWGRTKALLNGRYGSDSRCIPLASKDFDAVLNKYNPMMICLNDGEGCTDEDRKRMVEFLKRKYPDKSSFEK